MNKVTDSLIHSFIGRYTFILINLISMMTYARLLTPEEIGVHVIAIAASSIIIELRLIGTGSYLIKLKEIQKEDSENVLFVTLCISLFLGFGLLLISDLLSNFYSTPGMSSVIEILFGTFLLTPFTAVSQSYFARTFNFKMLALINVLSAFFSFILTVVLIKAGLSYLSLAFGVLFSQLFQFIAHFLMKSNEVSWIPKPGNVKKILSFGGTLTFVTIINKGLESIPELILGKTVGTSASALFSRAFGAVKFSNDTVLGFVSPVVTPYLAQAKRDGEYAAQAFEKATSHATILIIPILLSLATVPEVAISLLFGEQWLAASEIVSILCVAMALKAPIQFITNMLIVEEKETYLLYIKLFTLPVFIASVLAIGAEGMLEVALAFSLAQLIEVCCFYLVAFYRLEFLFKIHFSNQLKSFIVAAICMLISFSISQICARLDIGLLTEAAILSLLLSITWLSAVIVIKHEITVSLYKISQKIKFLNRFKLERLFLN